MADFDAWLKELRAANIKKYGGSYYARSPLMDRQKEEDRFVRLQETYCQDELGVDIRTKEPTDAQGKILELEARVFTLEQGNIKVNLYPVRYLSSRKKNTGAY